MRAQADAIAREPVSGYEGMRQRYRRESNARSLASVADRSDTCLLSTGFDNDGTAVSVRGNLRTARNVLVMVPGTDSTASSFGGIDADAGRVQEAAGSDTFVVAWLGYDAPEGNGGGIATGGRADVGAPGLAAFVASLGNGRRVSVSGHRDGSLVAGKAVADRGARVDNLIFLGSPGVQQDSASAFGTRVWAAEAAGDPIRFVPSQVFGPHPVAGSFGAIRFRTGGSSGHSQYYQRESLDNIIHITRGEYCDVTLVSAPPGWAMGCAAAPR